MAESQARSGGCLCGGVRYEVEGPLRPIVMCHCTQCRRSTGHFLAATAARRVHLRLRSAETLAWFDSSPQARRGFCARCGSTLFWDDAARDYLSIAAGSLDDTRGLAVACHIFVADKGDYYQILDAAPQIEGGDFAVPWS